MILILTLTALATGLIIAIIMWPEWINKNNKDLNI